MITGPGPQLICGTGAPVLKPTNTTNYALASLDLASANTFFYVALLTNDGSKDVLGMATYPLYRMSNGSTSSCTFGYSPAPVYFHNGVEQSTTPTRDEAYDFMSAVSNGCCHLCLATVQELNMFIGGQTTYMIEAQELIIWKRTKTQQANRSGIEGNVNAHFQIGNFGTPTSGLLYDYSGAAAAYSVRQLANTAALAMRVREDGTDTETDIGFDSNGDLDTAAIATHCGANNGYVVTWYDQSGEQLDATQTTNANQPQIYDGSMINLNGKPLVKATRGGGLAAGFKPFLEFGPGLYGCVCWRGWQFECSPLCGFYAGILDAATGCGIGGKFRQHFIYTVHLHPQRSNFYRLHR